MTDLGIEARFYAFGSTDAMPLKDVELRLFHAIFAFRARYFRCRPFEGVETGRYEDGG